MSILIKDALTVRKERVDVYVEDNQIVEIGRGLRVEAEHRIDASQHLIIPGLINMHTHAAMVLFRGYADDMPLEEWLSKKIWPLEAKLKEEHVYWASRLACLEMLKSGTTCFNDMYWHPEATARAAKDAGIRAFVAAAFIDLFNPSRAEEMRRETKRFLRFVEGLGCERVRAALGPHAIYTVSPQSLSWVKELSENKGLLVHFHLSETEAEVRKCVKEHGKKPAEYLEELGFLQPRLICAHCVHLSKREVWLLAKHKVRVVHNPTSNMKLAVGGLFPYSLLEKAGVLVSLGTDGCASNNNLDMLEEMKFASLLQKFGANDPTAGKAKKIFDAATLNASEALGIRAGRLEEGSLADIVLLDARSVQLLPGHDPISDIVYSANSSCVDTVICDGEILVREGKSRDELEVKEGFTRVVEEFFSD